TLSSTVVQSTISAGSRIIGRITPVSTGEWTIGDKPMLTLLACAEIPSSPVIPNWRRDTRRALTRTSWSFQYETQSGRRVMNAPIAQAANTSAQAVWDPDGVAAPDSFITVIESGVSTIAVTGDSRGAWRVTVVGSS